MCSGAVLAPGDLLQLRGLLRDSKLLAVLLCQDPRSSICLRCFLCALAWTSSPTGWFGRLKATSSSGWSGSICPSLLAPLVFSLFPCGFLSPDLWRGLLQVFPEAMASDGKDMIPSRDGSARTWRRYTREVAWFFRATPSHKQRYVATKLLSRLTGSARLLAMSWTEMALDDYDGTRTLLRRLSAGPLVWQSLPNA